MTRTIRHILTEDEIMDTVQAASLLAGHEMDADQETLVRRVASGEMTAEDALAAARELLK